MAKTQILIVEDEIISARSLEHRLTKMGFEIMDTVSSGEEAIQRIETECPNLVLMDIRLHGELDGVQTARVIRERFEIPVIYLTAHAEDETIQRATTTEPYGYLLKPFDPNELRITIDMALYKHEMEKALRQSESIYRGLFESNSSIMVLVDPNNGKIMDANPAACKFYGYLREEFLNKDISDLYVIPREEVLLNQRRAFEQKRNHFFFRHRLSSGEIRHVESYSGPILFRGRQLLYSIVHDITERKRAEEALSESEERYRLLFSTMLNGFALHQLLVDTNGKPYDYRFLEANPAFEAMTGLKVDDILGKTVSEVIPNVEEFWIDKYGEVAQTGIPTHFEQFSKPLNRYYEVFAYCPRRGQFATLIADVTERKLGEEKLHQHALDRERDLAILYQVAAIANEPLELEALLKTLLSKVMQATQSIAGYIYLHDEAKKELRLAAHTGDSVNPDFLLSSQAPEVYPWGVIMKTRQPLTVGTSSAEFPRIWKGQQFNFLGAPIRRKDGISGILSVLNPIERPFTVDEMALLMAVSDQLGLSLESITLRRQSEAAAVIEERQRLARELHDSVTQSLYSLNLLAQASRDRIEENDRQDLETCLDEIEVNATQALKEMRLLLYELRPAVLEESGLVTALEYRLEAVEKRAGIQTHLRADPCNLPKTIQVELYRIVNEALNNSLKHANATSIEIEIHCKKSELQVNIWDDGIGFDQNQITKGGLGLIAMRERASKLGANLEITSKSGKGTHVILKLSGKNFKEGIEK